MSKKLKVLVTGSRGFVGSHFVARAKEYELLTPEIEELDLRDLVSVKKYITEKQPDWIINLAAFTDVNKAEEEFGDESGVVWTSNVEAVRNLVETFGGKRLIHISTDMVFPGNETQPGPYREDDLPPETPEKLTWYGWTKNRGEKHVRDAGGVVVRIIYPVAVTGTKPDYIRSVLKRYVDDKMYPLFADQQVSITHITDLVEVLKAIIDEDIVEGVFHVSSDTTTPHQLLQYAIDLLGGEVEKVKSSSIHEFLENQPNKNRYPVFGGLSTTLTAERLERQFPSWQMVVERLIAEGLSF